jgi:hypothetical protein
LPSVGKGYAAGLRPNGMAMAVLRVVKQAEFCMLYSMSKVFLYLLRVAAKVAAHIILLALTVELNSMVDSTTRAKR